MFGTMYVILAALTFIVVIWRFLLRPEPKDVWYAFAMTVFAMVCGFLWPITWLVASILIISDRTN